MVFGPCSRGNLKVDLLAWKGWAWSAGSFEPWGLSDLQMTPPKLVKGSFVPGHEI